MIEWPIEDLMCQIVSANRIDGAKMKESIIYDELFAAPSRSIQTGLQGVGVDYLNISAIRWIETIFGINRAGQSEAWPGRIKTIKVPDLFAYDFASVAYFPDDMGTKTMSS